MRNKFGQFTKVVAYAFRSALGPQELLERLKARSGRRWGFVDSDGLGKLYASTIWDDPNDGKNRVRILLEDEADEYVVDVLYSSVAPSAEQEWPVLVAYVRDELLPLLEATGIRDTHDRSS